MWLCANHIKDFTAINSKFPSSVEVCCFMSNESLVMLRDFFPASITRKLTSKLWTPLSNPGSRKSYQDTTYSCTAAISWEWMIVEYSQDHFPLIRLSDSRYLKFFIKKIITWKKTSSFIKIKFYSQNVYVYRKGQSIFLNILLIILLLLKLCSAFEILVNYLFFLASADRPKIRMGSLASFLP